MSHAASCLCNSAGKRGMTLRGYTAVILVTLKSEVPPGHFGLSAFESIMALSEVMNLDYQGLPSTLLLHEGSEVDYVCNTGHLVVLPCPVMRLTENYSTGRSRTAKIVQD